MRIEAHLCEILIKFLISLILVILGFEELILIIFTNQISEDLLHDHLILVLIRVNQLIIPVIHLKQGLG